ncbi:MAG: discoidin domain-containing protein [Gluconacetobacter diazotrophicus]|nr:discoidin domain-containing protein [Gluconacetobacter diazotrophicus]
MIPDELEAAAAPRWVAAFRAYKWNDDIASLAKRFFANCPGARHVVLLNEEHGPIDVGSYETVSHGRDFSAWGLPERPSGQSPWYNSDYVYCQLRLHLPDHDYYLVSESDVAVNGPFEPVVRHAAANRIDAVVHQLGPVDPRWAHHPAALAQRDPLRCFLFVCLFSGRALDTILAGRQTLARHPDFAARPWPIVESFVPTILRDAGMRIAEMSLFFDTLFLRYRPFLPLSSPHASRPRSLAHPVLGPADLATALLYDQPPRDFFRRGSVLNAVLSREPLDRASPPLIDAFARSGDHAGVALLHAELRARGLPFPHRADLAYAKPALLSSASQWSRGHDPALDAAGANGAVLHPECAFHTDREVEAWWHVDLLDPCLVHRVSITNRVDVAERFRRFAIDTSLDGSAWQERHRKNDDAPVSGDDAAPHCVAFPEPVSARFVRIRRLGPPDYLHLRRVRVFGEPLPFPAASPPAETSSTAALAVATIAA